MRRRRPSAPISSSGARVTCSASPRAGDGRRAGGDGAAKQPGSSGAGDEVPAYLDPREPSSGYLKIEAGGGELKHCLDLFSRVKGSKRAC